MSRFFQPGHALGEALQIFANPEDLGPQTNPSARTINAPTGVHTTVFRRNPKGFVVEGTRNQIAIALKNHEIAVGRAIDAVQIEQASTGIENGDVLSTLLIARAHIGEIPGIEDVAFNMSYGIIDQIAIMHRGCIWDILGISEAETVSA
jgi:hypothetical protein